MRKGAKAIHDAADNAKGGGYSGRLGYFGLKADESMVIRFLTDVDDIITVNFYEFIRTLKKDSEGKPILSNFIVAPDLYDDDPNWDGKDWVLEFGGKQLDYNTKELIDPIAKERTVALAVVREEVPVVDGPNGRPIITYKDSWTDVESGGKTFEGRKFIIVRQAHKNFWTPLMSFYDEYGTLCDRDYKIKRVGKTIDTTYTIMPKTPDSDWNYDGSSYADLHARYGYGTGKNIDGEELTPDSEDRFAYCPQTLDEWAYEHASEERARYFLTESGDEQQQQRSDRASSNGEADEAQAAPPPAAAPRASSGGSLESRLARHMGG